MADVAADVVLLAGRMAAREDRRRVRRLVDRLAAFGVSARVISSSGGDGSGIEECPGLDRFWQRAWAVRRLEPGPGRPALLHVLGAEMSEVGLALADRWRVPYVLTIDEFLAPGARLRLSRRWCRTLLAPCRELEEDLIRGLGVPRSMTAVVAPGQEVSDGDPCAEGSGRIPVIGTAGPLTAGSGVATFLDAARRVVDAGIDAEFVIAGQGRDEVDLRRRAEALQIADRVTFAEDPANDGTFWKVLNVFCQPSVVATVGRTLGTALAFGVPSIASDVAGLRSWVADEMTGLRVPPGDPVALSGAIVDLLGDGARARTLGRRGREWIATHFEPEREAEALVAAYREAIGSAVIPLARLKAPLASTA